MSFSDITANNPAARALASPDVTEVKANSR
jgi:hypothetical protein